MVITDESVRGAAKIIYELSGGEYPFDAVDESETGWATIAARAVLEYAATLVPVVPEWPSHLGRAPTLGNIVRRLQTAEQRADILRCVSTIIECPEEDSPEDHARRIMERLAHAPAAPPRPFVAERLVAYRCASLGVILTVRGSQWTTNDTGRVEELAHAMLAAEKEPA